MENWMKNLAFIFYLSLITITSFAQQSELRNNLIKAVNEGDLTHTQAYIAAIESMRISGSLRTRLCLWLRGNPFNICDAAGKPLLICAIRQGKRNIILYLLDAGADVNKRAQYNRWTPLMYAAADGAAETVKALLDKGACVNTDANGQTPLAVAARMGHFVIVKLLLERGARPNLFFRRFEILETSPLHYAAHQANLRIMWLLLQYGAHVNKYNEVQQTPLLLAAKSGHPQATEILLQHGAFPALKDYEGKTPLTIACIEGYTVIVRQLCAHSCPPTKRERNKARELALKHGHLEIADILFALNKQPQYQRVPTADPTQNNGPDLELTQPLLDT